MAKARGRRRSRRFRRRQLGKGDARAKALTRDLEGWIGSLGDRLMREAIDEMQGKRPNRTIAKASLTSEQQRALDIITRHGLRQMKDAGAEWRDGYVVPNRRVEAFIREKEILVQGLTKDIEAEFRKNLASALAVWMAEIPTPSMGAIARRIRENFFIKPDKETGARLTPIPGGQGLVRTVHGRAELIARTEMATARNAGHLDGMEAAGIRYKEWVAVTGDTKSGERKHNEMDGVRVPIGEDFVLPDGTRMPAPGIGPVHQTANCRCTVIAAKEP